MARGCSWHGTHEAKERPPPTAANRQPHTLAQSARSLLMSCRSNQRSFLALSTGRRKYCCCCCCWSGAGCAPCCCRCGERGGSSARRGPPATAASTPSPVGWTACCSCCLNLRGGGLSHEQQQERGHELLPAHGGTQLATAPAPPHLAVDSLALASPCCSRSLNDFMAGLR